MNHTISLVMLLAISGCVATPTLPIVESGTPDLTIHAFVPPVIFAGAGDTIYISDLTANIGDGPSKQTVIRYYISDSSPIDVTSAVVIGERQVPALAVDESNESLELPFIIPEGFGLPPLFLAACVDVDNYLAEIYEENNCTTNRSGIHQMQFDSGMVVPHGVAPDPNGSQRLE